MTPVRIGYVRYLNTTPLVEGVEKLAGVELSPAAPSLIAGLVLDGGVDLGLVSLIDLARSTRDPRGPLRPVAAGMIGCDGPTLTVRLFSRVPMERVRRLHADSESHTSVVLARVLLSRVFGASPEVVEFDARERFDPSAAPGSSLDEAWPETVLLIGDKVITDPPPAERYPHVLDLGQAWRELTGLPFVYAAWMCRAARAQDPEVARAALLLDRQRRRNELRLDWIIDQRAGEHRWPAGVARRYLGELLRFEVTPAARGAAERFLHEAAALGLAPPCTPDWLEVRDLAGAGAGV